MKKEEVKVLNIQRKKGKFYYVNGEGNAVEIDTKTKEEKVVATPSG